MGLLAASSPQVQGASYQAAVKALKPTYYFQLDETSTTGGVVDSMGKAQPGSYNGNYNGTAGEPSVGFAGAIELFGGTVDGSNGGELLPPIKVPGLGGKANVSHNSNNRGHIILAGPNTDYGANAMTVAFFMKAGPSQGGDRIFTNNIAGDPTKSFQIDCGNNGLVLAVDPTKTGLEAERTLYLPGGADRDKRLINPAYGWFHIVASTSGTTGAERASNFQVWVNGVDRTDDLKPDATGWGVETGSAKIGGRGTNPTAAQTHSGAQDEVSIWLDKVLTEAEVQSLWKAATAPTYAEKIVSLKPNYYFRLDETDTANGVVDTMGNAKPGSSFNGDYLAVDGPVVGGPGPETVYGDIAVPGLSGQTPNVAHYSNNKGHIILGGTGADYGANAMTVAMFIKAGPPQGGDRIFTNNLADNTKSFQIVTANNGLVLAIDPNEAGPNAERTLYKEDNSGPDRRLSDGAAGWFHVIASTSGDTAPERASNFRLWVNGVDRTDNLKPDVTGWGINTDFAKIGGRRDNPLDSTTHSGAQDEVAIWLDRVLTDSEALQIWTSALAEGPPFSISGVSRDAVSGDVTLDIESVEGAAYAVERATNPAGPWTLVATNLVSAGTTTQYVDASPEAHAAGRIFYRALRTR